MRMPGTSFGGDALSRRRGQKAPRNGFSAFWVLVSVMLGILCAIGFLLLSMDSRPYMHNLDSIPSYLQQPARAGNVNDAAPKIKILYTLFAGRKNRLLVQEPYWAEMVELGAIDEVHLWDYCFDEKDRRHLHQLAEKYPSFLKVMRPQDVSMRETYWFDRNHSLPGAKERHGDPTEGRATFLWPPERGYTEYFQYYASTNHVHDIVIKADDDIVWINTTMVRPFAEYMWNRTDVFLLSASVVNQGLCAYYQQKHAAIPRTLIDVEFASNGMGRLHDNATQALTLHRYFLSSEDVRRKFYITEPPFYPFTFTINVNFVAMRGSDFPEFMELIQEKLVEEGRYYDEGAITWDPIRKRGKLEGIYMPLVTAHATFGAQAHMTGEILAEYVAYAKRERSDLYGNILDDWAP